MRTAAIDLVRAQVAERLRRQAISRGEFAERLGKSDAWISQFLRGQRSIRIEVLDQIAEFFEIEPRDLFEDPRMIALLPTPPLTREARNAQTRLLERQQTAIDNAAAALHAAAQELEPFGSLQPVRTRDRGRARGARKDPAERATPRAKHDQ